ncbi:MAG: hypothetical protein HN413_01430 [Chloroflexi bacterium]|jgi:hypothetical protein|nr:hypothetical protein [Chloroflexota bacterium]
MPKLRLIKIPLLLIPFTLIFTACGTAAPTGTSAPEREPLAYSEMSLGTDEFIHISGHQSVVTKPFTLEGAGGLRVYWRQDCDEFVLKTINTNETLAEAPLGTLIHEGILGPSEAVDDPPWVVPFEYVPGEYVMSIEAKGDCTWEVWAKVIFPEGS